MRVFFARLSLDIEEPLEECPVRGNPQVALAEHDKARYVLHRVGRYVVQLHAIHAQKGKEERVQRERGTSCDVVDEGNAFVVGGRWPGLVAGTPPSFLRFGLDEPLAFERLEKPACAAGLDPAAANR